MKVAILVTDGFEQSELTEPKKALEQAGAQALIVAPKSGEIQGMNHDEKADKVRVDMALDQAASGDFDAVMLPGGALNADHLRVVPEAQEKYKGSGIFFNRIYDPSRNDEDTLPMHHYAAQRILTVKRTVAPRRASISISASVLKRSMRPRRKSLTRG